MEDLLNRRRAMLAAARQGDGTDWETVAKCMLFYDGVETDIVLPDGMTTLPLYALRGRRITSITTNPELGSIGLNAVGSLPVLRAVTLNEGLTTINGSNFRDCTFAHNDKIHVVLPSTIKTIGTYCFYNSSNADGTAPWIVTCLATTPPTLGNYCMVSTLAIYVPDESLEAYKAATNWSTYAGRIYPISEFEGGVTPNYQPFSALCGAERSAA